MHFLRKCISTDTFLFTFPIWRPWSLLMERGMALERLRCRIKAHDECHLKCVMPLALNTQESQTATHRAYALRIHPPSVIERKRSCPKTVCSFVSPRWIKRFYQPSLDTSHCSVRRKYFLVLGIQGFSCGTPFRKTDWRGGATKRINAKLLVKQLCIDALL